MNYQTNSIEQYEFSLSGLFSPQRRWERRLSREMSENLSIETYLYRCDPYRSSTVQVPWPYGVKVTHEFAMRELILAYKNDIRDTFIRHDGLGVMLNFTVRRAFPTDQPSSTVLSIGIENDPISTRDLSIVRDAVRGLLMSRGLKTVHVDIFDWDRRFLPVKFGISPHHPAVIEYNRVEGIL